MKLMGKTGVVIVVAVGLLALTPQRTYAGKDRGWETAGKVLAGVAAVGVIAAIASQHDASVNVRYDYGSPRWAPPPPPQRAGHFEVQRERVTIPGYWTEERTPAQYAWVKRGCRQEWVMVQPPCVRRLWVPQRSEWREAKVWVPAPPHCRGYARAW